jgi:hypothetical protein
MLQERLNFELFRTQQDKDRFLDAIDEVGKTLARFPPEYQCSGQDTQVFGLQQRSIGELMTIRNEDGSQQCMSYPDFQRKLNEPQFSQHFMPLLALLEDVKPSDDCRWRRLQETRQALEKLQIHCNRLLRMPAQSQDSDADMPDNSGHEARENRPDSVDKEVTLKYIDQTYQTLSKVWSARSWVVLATTVLSLVSLGASTGVLTTDGSFPLSGFKLTVSLPVFLWIGNVILTALVISWYGLTTRAQIFREQIVSYYKSLNFCSRDMLHWTTSPFRAPSVYDLLVGLYLPGGWEDLKKPAVLRYPEEGLFRRLLVGLHILLVLFVLVLFPFVLKAVAEILAVLRLASIFGWGQVLAWVPLLFTVVITVLAWPGTEWTRNLVKKHIDIGDIPE